MTAPPQPDTWPLMAAYLASDPYLTVAHLVDSYDHFLDATAPAVVAAANESFVMQKRKEVGRGIDHDTEFRVTVDDLRFCRPTVSVDGNPHAPLFPNIARSLDLDYNLLAIARVTITGTNKDTGESAAAVYPDVKVGEMPLMLHSRRCYLRDADDALLRDLGEDPLDTGGYFVTRGEEKIVVTQQAAVVNRPVLYLDRSDEFVSASGRAKPSVVLAYASADADATAAPVTTMLRARWTKDGVSLTLRVSPLRADVDVFTVLRAIGVQSDRDILEHVIGMRLDTAEGLPPAEAAVVEFLRPALSRAAALDRQQALDHIAMLTPYGQREAGMAKFKGRADSGAAAKRALTRGGSQAEYILGRELLAGYGDDPGVKALVLGGLVRRLARACLGSEPPTDREHLGNKRMLVPGALLAQVFEEAYGKLRSNAMNMMDQIFLNNPNRQLDALVTPDLIDHVIDSAVVSDVMRASFRGNWGEHGGDKYLDSQSRTETGVVQPLPRKCFMGTMSMKRRVNTPIDPELKIVEPRRQHGTQHSVMCPAECPDGGNVGLHLHLACTTSITTARPAAPTVAFLLAAGCVPAPRVPARELRALPARHQVFVNGILSFVTDDARAVVHALRDARAAGELEPDTGVSWDIARREVAVNCDGGRCVRPLLLKGRAEAALNRVAAGAAWRDLLLGAERCVELLDVEEVDTAAVIRCEGARSRAAVHTHEEVHACSMFSAYTLTFPLLQHNQSVRSSLGGVQGKHAIGVHTTSFASRMDNSAALLHNPQRPLVYTRVDRPTGADRRPCGQNAIVAILCRSGFNMEDAVILNRAAVERGVFDITYLHTVVTTESIGEMESTLLGNVGAPRGLAADGLPVVDRPVVRGEALLALKHVLRAPGAGGKAFVETDATRLADEHWHGHVVDNVLAVTRPGPRPETPARTVKVRYRQSRPPRVGDKLASRHGQKGVVGLIMDAVDMPTTADGVTPDMIINPHAFPSRMTIGHVFESVYAKAAAVRCQRAECLVFETPSLSSDDLAIHGLQTAGEEVMSDGCTGALLEADVFVGPTYYQRLKQMVEDKINYRREGANSVRTRQPTQGRANGGGLRIGEMERDALLAHGVMGFTYETFMGRSDGTQLYTDAAGNVAVANEESDRFISLSEPADQRFDKRIIPHNFNSLVHELAAMHIGVHMMSDDHARQEDDGAPQAGVDGRAVASSETARDQARASAGEPDREPAAAADSAAADSAAADSAAEKPKVAQPDRAARRRKLRIT